MAFKENVSLKKYNTFGIDVSARFFITVNSYEDLSSFFSSYKKDKPFLILGGGSNILFTENFDGYVLKIALKGQRVIHQDADSIVINVSAGEDWDEFVAFCTSNNYGGLENLSLIPGQVGSCPIQNIGAYGAEVKDNIVEVNTFNTGTFQKESFSNNECHFAYRSSIFKTSLKHTHIITDVTFKLSKKPKPLTSYGAIREKLSSAGIATPTIADVRGAVCEIRNSKLPNPETIGNAGSFFKNPEVSAEKHRYLLQRFPDLVAYELESNRYKLAAGWLIDKAGWKGQRFGDAGVHEKQALVLVNHGHATGNDILKLAEKIKSSIYDIFDIELEYEVNII